MLPGNNLRAMEAAPIEQGPIATEIIRSEQDAPIFSLPADAFLHLCSNLIEKPAAFSFGTPQMLRTLYQFLSTNEEYWALRTNKDFTKWCINQLSLVMQDWFDQQYDPIRESFIEANLPIPYDFQEKYFKESAYIQAALIADNQHAYEFLKGYLAQNPEAKKVAECLPAHYANGSWTPNWINDFLAKKIKELASLGIKLEKPFNDEECRPITRAIKVANQPVLRALVESGADVNAMDWGRAPLCHVFFKYVFQIRMALVNILLEAKNLRIDERCTGEDNDTPLMLAALHGDFPIVIKFIACGADPLLGSTVESKTAAQLARMKDHDQLAEYLEKQEELRKIEKLKKIKLFLELKEKIKHIN